MGVSSYVFLSLSLSSKPRFELAVLIKLVMHGTYSGGSPDVNRMIAVVTDNGKDADGDRYTNIKYCASVAYVKDDKAELVLCQ